MTARGSEAQDRARRPYVLISAVVGEGRKPPSAPEFGTPHDDVSRGRPGNVQFGRVRVTDLPGKDSGMSGSPGMLGDPTAGSDRQA